MTSNEFRKMALGLPEVVESSHMEHPDFRVGGKIFATLGFPDAGWAMVKLTPDEQELFVQIEPGSFQPVKGGWGRQGATNVRLQSATRSTVRVLLSGPRSQKPREPAHRRESPQEAGRARENEA